MAWIVTRDGALGRTISKAETKTCSLCGALNYFKNRECFACDWRGAFEQDTAAIDYHWQRLMDRHEEVRLEHVTSGHSRAVGDFGRPHKIGPWQRLSVAFAQRWASILSRQEARRVIRETTPRPKSALPPL